MDDKIQPATNMHKFTILKTDTENQTLPGGTTSLEAQQKKVQNSERY